MAEQRTAANKAPVPPELNVERIEHPLPVIEVEEEDYSPTDSAIGGSDGQSYATSLLSEMIDYKYENGRRYHSYRAGQCVLPNDEQEQDREDLLHHVRNLHFGGHLFHAPIPENVEHVFDIGTGTGMACSSKHTSPYSFGKTRSIIADQLIIKRYLGHRLRRHPPQRPSNRHRPQPHPTRLGPSEPRILRR